jgi:hypothetical protein
MRNLQLILPFILFSGFSFAQSQVQTASKIQLPQKTSESSVISNNKEENTTEVRQTNQRIVKKEQIIVVEKSNPQEEEKKEINSMPTSNKRAIE